MIRPWPRMGTSLIMHRCGPRRSLWRWVKEHQRLIAYVVLAMTLGMFATTVPIQRHTGWMCGICGSRNGERTILGATVHSYSQQSALELWMIKHGWNHAHDWHCIQGTNSSLLGNVISVGHGQAPALMRLGGMDPLYEFVRLSSDEEIGELLRALQNGTPVEQKEAVDRAGDMLIERLYQKPRETPARQAGNGPNLGD